METTKRKRRTRYLTDIVIEYLAANPGPHTPVQVAVAIRRDKTRVAHTLIYLAREGRVTRNRTKVNGDGASTYATL